MVSATLVFALTFIAHLDGYEEGTIGSLALILGIVAEGLLAAGGFIGGTIVFVYGVRVLKRPDTAVANALVPGRAESDPLEELEQEVGAARPPGPGPAG